MTSNVPSKLNMFKSELRAYEKCQLRRLEAYFTTLEYNFKSNLSEILKAPPGIDFSQWNHISTNCTYVKKCDKRLVRVDENGVGKPVSTGKYQGIVV